MEESAQRESRIEVPQPGWQVKIGLEWAPFFFYFRPTKEKDVRKREVRLANHYGEFGSQQMQIEDTGLRDKKEKLRGQKKRPS
jgi:hypothetical protein